MAAAQNLPVPTDDGACDHLPNSKFPDRSLQSTSGKQVNISTLPGLTIIFCYPRTGGADEVIPDEWNAIPGARGCTPQACSFRDSHDTLHSLGVTTIFGLSTQSTTYQLEARNRLHLSYELLSDEDLDLVKAMGLPTMVWEHESWVGDGKGEGDGEKRQTVLCKRVTLAVREGKVVKVWYPVFPTHESAARVEEWLKEGGDL